MIIVLVGSPFSGKTEILKKIKEEGIKVFHADSYIRKIYLKGEIGYKIIKDNFGKDFVNEKEVDRRKLGIFVAKNPEKLIRLNELIHPIVKDFLEEKDDYVAEIPVIIFSKIKFKYDKLILVKASEETISKRLAKEKSNHQFISQIIQKWDNLNIKFDYVIDTTNGIKVKDIDYIKSLFLK